MVSQEDGLQIELGVSYLLCTTKLKYAIYDKFSRIAYQIAPLRVFCGLT